MDKLGISDVISFFNNKYDGQNIEKIAKLDDNLYSKILDFCLENYENQKSYQFIKDIYETLLKDLEESKIQEAYLNFINAFDGHKRIKKETNYIYDIALDYYYGRVLEKNGFKAYKWLLLSLNVKEDRKAYYMLGNCHFDGFGTEVNKEEAFKYFTLSAKLQYPPACNDVGYCYQHGIGVQKNITKAIYWYTKASDNYNYVAKHNLASIYEDESYPKNDIFKALNYYYEAAGYGYAKSIKRLEKLGFSNEYEFDIDNKKIDYDTYYLLNGIKTNGSNVLLPSHITTIGYDIKIIKESYMEGDYHHFKTTFYPTEIEYIPKELELSNNIKKIYIPLSVNKISEIAFNKLENIEIIIHPLNKYYYVLDNSLIEKNTNKIIYKF